MIAVGRISPVDSPHALPLQKDAFVSAHEKWDDALQDKREFMEIMVMACKLL